MPLTREEAVELLETNEQFCLFCSILLAVEAEDSEEAREKVQNKIIEMIEETLED